MPYSLLARGEAPHVATIDEGTDDQVEAHGYSASPCRKCLYHAFCFLSCGVLLLLVKWFPLWRVWITCRPATLATATILVLKDVHGDVAVIDVKVDVAPSSLPSSFIFDRIVSSSGVTKNIYRHFFFKNVKYVWDSQLASFQRLRGFEGLPCAEFHEKFVGYNTEVQADLRQLYGPNLIDIKVQSIFRLLYQEVLNPFYFFQAASMVLWGLDDYMLYAMCILTITVITIVFALYVTRKNERTLKDMVSKSNTVTITVCRSGDVFEEVPASQVVPGDVIAIPPNGGLMACDAVLIAGNCIVNESMLTGESVPETKTPLPREQEAYDPVVHKRHTLFCGTDVIQTRYYQGNRVLAVVLRTGFSTAKGELVRSILFPKPVGFKFYRDSFKFVGVLFAISGVGMAYSIYLYIQRGASASVTIIRALDIITIVVPPALPAAMTVGTLYAQNRLKAQKIFCISPQRIVVGGKLKLMCFDKTGTLTEEGLDFWGIIPTVEGKFREVEHEASALEDEDPMKVCMASCHSLTVIENEIKGDPIDIKMFHATNWDFEEPGADNSKYDQLNPTVVRPAVEKHKSGCNGLENGDIMMVQDSGDKLLSFPLSPTKHCDLDENKFPYEVGILRQFPFSSHLQMMSVICRTMGHKNMDIYCKGAPEKIVSLCNSDSVPVNFAELLKDYALQGYRVLALAHRNLGNKMSWRHSQTIQREDVEKDLTFLGMLVMQNTLKPETTPVIKVLKDAKIRSVMVTGDNVMTAMSVARDCHLISESERVLVLSGSMREQDRPATLRIEYADSPPHLSASSSVLSEANGDCFPVISHVANIDVPDYHFVMDGKAFAVVRKHFPEIFKKVLLRSTVYARMAPDQKTQLVASLQDIGYVVGMCGDGANDCGALKAADVGISLSDTEASVAAPFTSNIPNITCVPIVIREGRTALVTSYSTFRFIAFYSLIQFISVLILYSVDTNLTDQMFLYIDLGIITFLAISMGYTGAYEKLVPKRPRCCLVSTPTIVSLLAQIFFVAIIQVAAVLFLQAQKWHIPVESGDEIFPCWENTTVFLVSAFQYVFAALLVSDGPPYRKHFFTNNLYLLVLLICFAGNIFLFFNPFASVAKAMALVIWQPNHHLRFRGVLLMLAFCNLFMALAFEMLVSNSRWLRWLSRRIKRKTEPKNEYKRIDNQLRQDYDFPPTHKDIIGTH